MLKAGSLVIGLIKKFIFRITINGLVNFFLIKLQFLISVNTFLNVIHRKTSFINRFFNLLKYLINYFLIILNFYIFVAELIFFFHLVLAFSFTLLLKLLKVFNLFLIKLVEIRFNLMQIINRILACSWINSVIPLLNLLIFL